MLKHLLRVLLLIVVILEVFLKFNFIKYCVVFLVLNIGCDENKIDEIDSDTGTVEVIDSDTVDTDVDTDTGEVYPAYPSVCKVVTRNDELSGDGDGRGVALVSNGNNWFSGWVYKDKTNENPTMLLQIAIARNGMPESFTPFEDSVKSTDVSVAVDGNTLAVAWIESRSEWDSDCSLENSDACDSSLAFMTFVDGVAAESLPIKLTAGMRVSDVPMVRRFGDKWIVVYARGFRTGSSTIEALFVEDDFSVSTPVVLSKVEQANKPSYLSVGVSSNVSVVSWLNSNQHSIGYVTIDLKDDLVSEIKIIDEGVKFSSPRVVAGKNEFLLSFSKMVNNGLELFTRKINLSGELKEEQYRISWTKRGVGNSSLAYDANSGYSIAWLSPEKNGATSCIDSKCSDKVFATSLDKHGALQHEPLLVSHGLEDLNSCLNPVVTSFVDGWVVAWQSLKNMRYQLSYSDFYCEVDTSTDTGQN